MKAVSVIFLAITLCYVVAVDLKQLDLKLRDLKEHDLGERDLEKMERELMERTAGDGIQPMQQCETEDGTYSHNQLIPHKDPCATCYCHNVSSFRISLMFCCGCVLLNYFIFVYWLRFFVSLIGYNYCILFFHLLALSHCKILKKLSF